MKKSILLILLSIKTVLSVAQITNVELSDDIFLDRLYLGINSRALLQMDSLESSNHLTVRPGAMLSYKPNNTFSIRSFGVMHFSDEQESFAMTGFEFILTPSTNIDIRTGLMATPTTELRPNPTTWESQVETNAQSTVLGGRPGVKVKYKFTPNVGLAYGVFSHNGIIGHHIKMTYHGLTLATYNEADQYFFAGQFKSDHLLLMGTHNYHKNSAVATLIHVTSSWTIYNDVEYNKELENLSYNEIGLRKYFKSEEYPISGFMAIGFEVQSRTAQGQFFIHL